MTKGSSGGGSYASKGYSGKGTYSGGSSLKAGYGIGNSMGYGGGEGILKGYGKEGLTSRLSGYFKNTYSSNFDKSSLSSRLKGYQNKGLQDKLYSDKEFMRTIREFLKENPDYFMRTCNPDEKIDRCPFCGGQLGKCACRN